MEITVWLRYVYTSHALKIYIVYHNIEPNSQLNIAYVYIRVIVKTCMTEQLRIPHIIKHHKSQSITLSKCSFHADPVLLLSLKKRVSIVLWLTISDMYHKGEEVGSYLYFLISYRHYKHITQFKLYRFLCFINCSKHISRLKITANSGFSRKKNAFLRNVNTIEFFFPFRFKHAKCCKNYILRVNLAWTSCTIRFLNIS